MKETTVTIIAASITALAALGGTWIGSTFSSSAAESQIRHSWKTKILDHRMNLIDRFIDFHLEASSLDPEFDVEDKRIEYIAYVHENVEHASDQDLELQRDYVKENSESYSNRRELHKEYSRLLAHARIYFGPEVSASLARYGQSAIGNKDKKLWVEIIHKMLSDIELQREPVD